MPNTDPAAVTYLTARLDQLSAATRDRDTSAADAVIENLIREGNPDAGRLIARAFLSEPARNAE